MALATNNHAARKAAAHKQAVASSFRRNVVAAVMLDSIWGLGLPFVLLAVIIPAYLNFLSSPKLVIGITSSLVVILMPVQLISVRLIGGVNRRRNVWLTFSMVGLCYIAYGFVGPLLPADPTFIRMSVFIVMIAMFIIAIHLSSPVYYAIITDNCPVRRRGRLLGLRCTGMGVAGLGSSFLAKMVYEHLSAPDSYHVAMVIAGTCFVFASACVLLFRDNIEPVRLSNGKCSSCRLGIWQEVFLLLRRLWLTPSYRVFIFFITVLTAAISLAPFIVTYGRDVVGMSADQERFFNLTFLAAAVVSGLALGTLADRWGYRLAAIFVACCGSMGYALAAAADTATTVLGSYGTYCIASLAMPMVLGNMSVELLPRLNPGRLVAAGYIFCLPAGVIMPVICGAMIDWFRSTGEVAEGYFVVFTIAIVLSVIGGLGMIFLVQEPRTGRVYVIKMLRRS